MQKTVEQIFEILILNFFANFLASQDILNRALSCNGKGSGKIHKIPCGMLKNDFYRVSITYKVFYESFCSFNLT